MSAEPSKNSFTRARYNWKDALELAFSDRHTFCQKMQPIECQKDVPVELQKKCAEEYRKWMEFAIAFEHWHQTN